ncbi:sensor histidine kinase [Gordonia hydrophobica]|uniref:histidine kinase n=1 Tax=Gordonia hydrophobica TaxID=40516 RepID=A0ABZ2U3R2_9ACTN|nr:HAMP domain-containing sensor histidine kinase [Gordonia hydrophobica]MBM7368581.1 two-component system sensor histidine kinase MtrB [Gordonia hydrophobica]
MIGRIRSSLTLRVLLGIVVTVVLTAGGVGAALTITARSWVYQDAQEQALATFTDEMTNAGRLRSSPAETSTTDTDSTDAYPDDAIVTVDGRVVRDQFHRAADVPADIRAAVDRTPGLYRFSRISDGRVAIGYQPSSGDSAGVESVFVVRSLGSVSDRIAHLLRLSAIAIAIAAAVGLLAGLLVMRWVLQSLRRVTRTAGAVAAGDENRRMPDTGIRELHDLTVTFNHMLDRHQESLAVLSEQEQRARRFASDVSHELRSPLAALVPAAEVLEEELADDPGVRGRAARLVGSEVTGLSSLVEDLLEMARRDAGTAEIRTERVDVVELVSAALRQRGWQRVPVTADDGTPALVTDPRRMTAVVTNLVGNALRHGDEPVSVEVATAPDGITVTVTDRGAGIAPEHLPHIFERMYKASDARTRTGGAGIGLAIARENARLLGGDVVYSREDGLTRFVATFADGA